LDDDKESSDDNDCTH